MADQQRGDAMLIDSIQIYRVATGPPGENNSDSHWQSEDGAREPAGLRESVVVAMWSGDHVGWGEVSLCAGPRGSCEWAKGAFVCVRDWLAPALVGRAIDSGEQLQQLLAEFTRNEGGKAVLDFAWWCLDAAQKRKPLYEQLGGQRRTAKLSVKLRQMASIDALLAAIQSALDQGYRPVSLEFRPGWDLEMLRAVRQTFSDAPLSVDCDGLCTLGQQETLYRLEDFFLRAIEQPLPAADLVGHAMLQANLHTPIMLEQSAASPAHVERAVDLGSCRAVRVDPARVGGLTPAVAIHDACQAAKIPCAVGAAQAGILQRGITLTLATLPNFSLPTEIGFETAAPSWILLGKGVQATMSDGELVHFQVPETGVAVIVDCGALNDTMLEHATVS